MVKFSAFLALSILISIQSSYSKEIFLIQVPNTSKFSCNTCHTNGGGTPRNPFGLDVKKNLSNNKINWTALSKLDSDGDGYTNGVELQDPNGTYITGGANPGNIDLVTRPGDKNNLPTSVIENGENINSGMIVLNSIFPNPANSSTKVSFSLKNTTDVEINLYNYDGSFAMQLFKGIGSKGENDFSISNKINNFSAGIYLIAIKSNSAILIDKIVVE